MQSVPLMVNGELAAKAKPIYYHEHFIIVAPFVAETD
jgi:hypothetical protein